MTSPDRARRRGRRATASRLASRSSTGGRARTPRKKAALSVEADGPADAPARSTSPTATPATSPRRCSPQFGYSADQFGCLDSLWTRESDWNPAADNPSSCAYGIPQALPGSKMASAGADWATNPVTQITWGLGYIRDRYGSPCGAWAHSESNGFY